MKLLLITLLLKGIHMKLLLILCHVLLLVCLYRTIAQGARVQSLKHYPTYDYTRRVNDIRAATKKFRLYCSEIALLIVCEIAILFISGV